MAEPENSPPSNGADPDDGKSRASASSRPPPSGGAASPKAPPEGAGAAREATPEGAASEAAVEFAEPEVVQDPLDVAKAEAAKYREQLLRTAADFENFRKRARREQDDATRRGKEQALKDLLPVFDNLERATVSAETAPDTKSVFDGLRMIGRQFTTTLEKMGIKRIATVGTPFDPALHEAIQHVHSGDHSPGVIAVEVQPGYLIGDHLLRAALVAVSKGPEEKPPEGDEGADGGDDTPEA